MANTEDFKILNIEFIFVGRFKKYFVSFFRLGYLNLKKLDILPGAHTNSIFCVGGRGRSTQFRNILSVAKVVFYGFPYLFECVRPVGFLMYWTRTCIAGTNKKM